jgi:hypothetical protein
VKLENRETDPLFKKFQVGWRDRAKAETLCFQPFPKPKSVLTIVRELHRYRGLPPRISPTRGRCRLRFQHGKSRPARALAEVRRTPPGALDVVAPEVGRKIRCKALKSLISRKKSEGRGPLFWGFWQGFSALKPRFAGKKRFSSPANEVSPGEARADECAQEPGYA